VSILCPFCSGKLLIIRVAVFVLPFPLLRHLHLNRNQVYGLLLTFALGLVTIAVNLARFITIQIGNNWNAVFIWSMAELAVAIMVVSLPALKTLIRRKNKGNNTSSKSFSNGRHYVVTASQHKSMFGRGEMLDDGSSEVELNHLENDVIYKTKEISVNSRPIEDSDDGGPLALAWTNNGYGGRASTSIV
jgi:hypothetical protein